MSHLLFKAPLLPASLPCLDPDRMYPLFWRWHFLIGLLVAPVLLLSCLTGLLYAFEPQLAPRLDPALHQLPPCPGCERQEVSALLRAAQGAVPGATLRRYLQPAEPDRSVEVLLDRDGELLVVFLDPWRGTVLGVADRRGGFFGTVLQLHRQLLAGEYGRWLVELVSSWVAVTLLLGLTLWWPRRARGGGAWWPRGSAQGRRFWRDLHSVCGFYALPLALLLVLTGLFFTPGTGKTWSAYNLWAGQLPTVLVAPPKSAAMPAGTAWAVDDAVADFLATEPDRKLRIDFPRTADGAMTLSRNLDRAVSQMRRGWYDLYRGERLAELRWRDLQPGAKAMLLMYPLHSGLIAGWPTQLLVALLALLMAGLTLSGLWMWRLRRPNGAWGLPPAPKAQRLPPALALAFVALAALLPLFGASVLLLGLVLGLRRSLKRPGNEAARVAPQGEGGH